MKELLEEIINGLDNNPTDTTPERIKANRGVGESGMGGGRTPTGGLVEHRVVHGFGGAFLKRRKQMVLPQHKDAFNEIVSLFEEYFNYFNTGYKAPHSIDELPSLLREKASALLEKL